MLNSDPHCLPLVDDVVWRAANNANPHIDFF